MDTSETYHDIPVRDLLDRWLQATEGEGRRAATLDNYETFGETLAPILHGLGVTTTGQITLGALNAATTAYKRRQPEGRTGLCFIRADVHIPHPYALRLRLHPQLPAGPTTSSSSASTRRTRTRTSRCGR